MVASATVTAAVAPWPGSRTATRANSITVARPTGGAVQDHAPDLQQSAAPTATATAQIASAAR